MLGAVERPVTITVFRADVRALAVAEITHPFEDYPLYIPHVV